MEHVDRAVTSTNEAHPDSYLNPTNRDAPRPERRRNTIALVVAAAVIAAVATVACGGSGGGTSVAQFCKDLDRSINLIDSANSGLAPPGKSSLEKVAAEMRKLASEAPNEVKDELKTSADFFQKASEHGVGSVDSKTTRSADAAGERINDYATSHCESAGS